MSDGWGDEMRGHGGVRAHGGGGRQYARQLRATGLLGRVEEGHLHMRRARVQRVVHQLAQRAHRAAVHQGQRGGVLLSDYARGIGWAG